MTISNKRINWSKVQPCEYKCLIQQEQSETEKRAAASGLALPPELRDREALAGVEAVLLAVGGNAFEDWKGCIPKPGDRVYTAKYAGFEVVGRDGQKYRMCNDKEIVAVIA